MVFALSSAGFVRGDDEFRRATQRLKAVEHLRFAPHSARAGRGFAEQARVVWGLAMACARGQLCVRTYVCADVHKNKRPAFISRTFSHMCICTYVCTLIYLYMYARISRHVRTGWMRAGSFQCYVRMQRAGFCKQVAASILEDGFSESRYSDCVVVKVPENSLEDFREFNSQMSVACPLLPKHSASMTYAALTKHLGGNLACAYKYLHVVRTRTRVFPFLLSFGLVRSRTRGH